MARKRSECRLIAMNMFCDGWEPKEISEVLEVSTGQIRQWKMLDKWDSKCEDVANPKELLLIVLSGAREGNRQVKKVVEAVCEALIERGYDEHGNDSKTLYKWLMTFIQDSKKVDVWLWIKYLWNKGDYGIELDCQGFLTNEVMLSIYNNTD